MTGPASFPPPRSRPLDTGTALELLRDGELEIMGRLLASTNNALVGTVTRRCPDPEPDLVAACVYKPTIGERPLDDFPDGTLSHREVAAFLVSESTGWGIVPPSVYRVGPFGGGRVQLWIDVDESVDPVQLVIDGDERLRRMAVFDAAVNNTDRKAGHLLPMEARSFVERAVRVLGSGRPPCPLCGQPLDPQGHLCPRRNGHLLN